MTKQWRRAIPESAVTEPLQNRTSFAGLICIKGLNRQRPLVGTALPLPAGRPNETGVHHGCQAAGDGVGGICAVRVCAGHAEFRFRRSGGARSRYALHAGGGRRTDRGPLQNGGSVLSCRPGRVQHRGGCRGRARSDHESGQLRRLPYATRRGRIEPSGQPADRLRQSARRGQPHPGVPARRRPGA